MIKNFEEIIQTARQKGPKTIAVAVAQDLEVLLAVKNAKDLGIAEAILVGNEKQIRQIAQENHLDISIFTIIEQPDIVQACRTAVRLVSEGKAQVLMKGMVDTAIVLKAVLDKDIGLRTENVLSHVAVADIAGYDRLFYITDAAMNIEPDLITKKQIIQNGVQVANALGNDNPKVACVCAVEKVNPKMKATVDADALVKMNESGELCGCLVAGPLALDNAVSLEAAQHKGITNPVAGNADILVMPFIEPGNMLYKSIVFFAKGKIAGIVVGAKAPIVLTSRADSDIAKLNSIAIGILMASKWEELNMKDKFRVLAINPGSTSTKIAVYDNEELLFEQVVRYSNEELAPFDTVIDQYEFRKNGILQMLAEEGVALESLDAVVGRGGLLKPIAGGTYAVNAAMLEALRLAERGEHASNLGGVIAKEIGDNLHIPSYIVDPVVVDELADIARVSGLPGYDRRSIFHALNQKAVARRISKELGKPYDKANLIIAHMGGGITVGVHQGGRVIDVNDALYGEGPFSPERVGSVPTGHMLELCFCGRYTLSEVKKLIAGKGGMVAYLGTNDGREVVKRIEAGDTQAKLIYEAMAYQIAKEIAADAAVLYGNVDVIVLTGGLAYDKMLVQLIAERVRFIAEIKVVPGENEMIALTEGALRVLRGEEEAKEY